MYLLTYTPRRRTTRFQRGLWGKACLYESVTPNAKGTGPQCIQIWEHLLKSTRSDHMWYDNMRGKACLKGLATQGDPALSTFWCLLLTPTRFDVERPNTYGEGHVSGVSHAIAYCTNSRTVCQR